MPSSDETIGNREEFKKSLKRVLEHFDDTCQDYEKELKSACKDNDLLIMKNARLKKEKEEIEEELKRLKTDVRRKSQIDLSKLDDRIIKSSVSKKVPLKASGNTVQSKRKAENITPPPGAKFTKSDVNKTVVKRVRRSASSELPEVPERRLVRARTAFGDRSYARRTPANVIPFESLPKSSRGGRSLSRMPRTFANDDDSKKPCPKCGTLVSCSWTDRHSCRNVKRK